MNPKIPPLVIAFDGHSSTGKSTFARSVARELGFTYIDSGAMYRAVTLFALREGMITDGAVDEEKLSDKLQGISIEFIDNPVRGIKDVYLNGENVEEEIRGIRVSSSVSIISKIGFVRKKLVALQRKMGENMPVVMDGRDIGTVVFPDADIKIFMTAEPAIRAERRYKELIGKGVQTDLKEVEKNILERDFIDQSRKESPLRKADDAIVLDNSYMTPEEQMVWFKNLLSVKFNINLQ